VNVDDDAQTVMMHGQMFSTPEAGYKGPHDAEHAAMETRSLSSLCGCFVL
jgi:hypothetical protein